MRKRQIKNWNHGLLSWCSRFELDYSAFTFCNISLQVKEVDALLKESKAQLHVAVTTNTEQYMKGGEHMVSRNASLNTQLKESQDREAALTRQIDKVNTFSHKVTN